MTDDKKTLNAQRSTLNGGNSEVYIKKAYQPANGAWIFEFFLSNTQLEARVIVTGGHKLPDAIERGAERAAAAFAEMFAFNERRAIAESRPPLELKVGDVVFAGGSINQSVTVKEVYANSAKVQWFEGEELKEAELLKRDLMIFGGSRASKTEPATESPRETEAAAT